MNSGDRLTVSLHDSPSGLVTKIVDHTNGQSGFMTASAANHFGHIKPAPSGTSCQDVLYDFHGPRLGGFYIHPVWPFIYAEYNVKR